VAAKESPKLIVIGGPTASGKSALAIKLAQHLARQSQPAEILSADSITVYRGFDIGSAKPTEEERGSVPHHLLDLANPDQGFTAGDFLKAADPLIHDLLSRGTVPIVAGGTGFYLRALLRGMAGNEEDAEKSAAVKLAIEERGRAEGFEKLHRELIAKDPGSAGTIHPKDHYRIVRALQAMEMQGKPWSELNAQARAAPARFPHRYFKIKIERDELRKRIEARVAQMLAQGLVEEVEGLLAKGVNPASKPMQSVGYKETLAFLRGDLAEEELAPAIVQATCKLAKQQNTWFRGEDLGEWLEEPYWENLAKAFD
jgi:tRNA dimethylallyltransferase